MTDAQNDGGPAFPFTHGPGGAEEGMSLRDWFAGQALAGYLANPNIGEILSGSVSIGGNTKGERLALLCLGYADAMIAERAKAGVQT